MKYIAPNARFSELAVESNFLASQIDDYDDNPIYTNGIDEVSIW